jgi:signal transduction histidine kinase
MMRTLRARLVAATAAVLAAVLTAFILFSTRMTRIEFHRMENVLVHERHQALSVEPVRGAVEEGFRAAGSWAAAQGAIDRAAKAAGQEVLVLDTEGKVAARSPGLAGAVVAQPAANTLRVDWPGASSARVILQVPGSPIRDAEGRVAGLLYLLPSPRSAAEPKTDFAGSANRWLAGAAVVAGLAALFLIAALSRRLLGPIESLTDAARKMEEGQRAIRVPVASRDELGELARSFNSMADAITRQEALRRNLVSDVAHELRTPLTNIRGQLEALQDGLSAPDRRTIDSLHEDARLLERLVDDLADSIVVADRDRVGQVLSNLIGNAITHTPAGGRIAISAQRRNGVVQTSVADTGTGIPAEHLQHVFDRFYRTDPSRARSSGGTGLGLAIVRQLIRAQNGDVAAISEPGQGTVISFTLPADS